MKKKKQETTVKNWKLIIYMLFLKYKSYIKCNGTYNINKQEIRKNMKTAII